MAPQLNPANHIVEVGRALYERGLIAGSEGNISARLDRDRILVTPSGLCKGKLNPDDLVVVDAEGRQLDGTRSSSSELPMHLHVYKARPDINGCVHSHAPYATAFAVAGVDLPGDVLPEMVLLLGRVPLTEYAPPGTESVGHSLDPFLACGSAFLLRNHGLLTIGPSLEEAVIYHETVEQCARIIHLARQLGNVNQIPGADLERLETIRQKRHERNTGREADHSDC